jgi:hypothetical protein
MHKRRLTIAALLIAVLLLAFVYACTSDNAAPVRPDTSTLDKDGGRLPMPADDPPPCCSAYPDSLGCNIRC